MFSVQTGRCAGFVLIFAAPWYWGLCEMTPFSSAVAENPSQDKGSPSPAKPTPKIVENDGSIKSILFTDNATLRVFYDYKTICFDLATGKGAAAEKVNGSISDRCLPKLSGNKILFLKANDTDIIAWTNEKEELLYRHDCSIWRCSFSLDNSILALQDAKQRIIIYDLRNKKQLCKQEMSFKSYRAAAAGIVLSSDARYCAAIYSGISLRTEHPLAVIDIQQEKLVYTHRGSADSLYTIAFHPTNPKQFAIPGSRRTVGLCDLTKQPILQSELEVPERAMLLAYTPCGQSLVTCCLGGKVVMISNGKVTPLVEIPDPPDTIQQIAISPDGKTLAVLVRDKGTSIYFVPLSPSTKKRN